jgi:hypothetical protein
LERERTESDLREKTERETERRERDQGKSRAGSIYFRALSEKFK